MSTKKKLFLLPYRFQSIGWIIVGVGILAFIAYFFLKLENRLAVTYPLYAFLAIYIGLFLVGFSREKREDEFTLHLRTNSALTAMLVIFAIRIVLGIVLVILQAKGVFQKDGIVDNLFDENTSFSSVFLLYLILYKVRLARYNKEIKDEE